VFNIYEDGMWCFLNFFFIANEDVPSEWLQNSSFKPEASELLNSSVEEDENEKLATNVQNSYKSYKKLHGKLKKKKDKKHSKKSKRSK